MNFLLPLLSLIILVLLFRMAAKRERRFLRAEIIAYLKERYPDCTITAEYDDRLEMQRGGGKETMFLDKVYAGVAALKPNTPEARRNVFRRFVDAVREHHETAGRALSLRIEGDFILPRLVTRGFVESMARQIKETPPHRPLSATGLDVVYVLDGEQSVMYLTGKHVSELGLDLEALHARALQNLGKKFPEETLRKILDSKAINVVKSLDSYDAARLLLVPQYLKEGETIAAAVPDRDTLLLAGIPADGNWSGLSKLARVAAGDVLLDRPLRVSSSGIELV